MSNTRTVWLIERASSPAALPRYLAEDAEEVLYWTGDRDAALRFTARHLAERFVRHRVAEAVVLADHVENAPTGWAAANIELRHRRDELDAFKARQAAPVFAYAA